ncbi:SH3 domain-containing protein [Solibacillus silvestris]|uniref:SH3 domain-containing protein n=1 Tax=Solibacillus silvestris TaxID=76853 RepID=UPI003F7FA74F
MKKMIYVFVAAFVLLAASVGFANLTEASTERAVHSAKTESAVYETAKTSAKQVATAYKGEFVTVISSKDGWSNVLFKGKKGYVKTDALSPKKAPSNVKQVSPKEGLKIYESPDAKSAVYSSLKQNAAVNDFGAVNKTWSFVQTGNVTGYALTASLKAKAAPVASSKSIGFYQGLVPIGLKNQKYSYFLMADGYGGHTLDKFVYAGSQASGKFSLTMTQTQDVYATDVYSETKTGFTFSPAYGRAPVKADYPLKVNNKKTYSAEALKFDNSGKEKKVKQTYTTTVTAVNGTFALRNGEKLSNVTVIEITGPDKYKASYVFRLNKGLIYSKSEFAIDGDYMYGETVELEGQ